MDRHEMPLVRPDFQHRFGRIRPGKIPKRSLSNMPRNLHHSRAGTQIMFRDNPGTGTRLGDYYLGKAITLKKRIETMNVGNLNLNTEFSRELQQAAGNLLMQFIREFPGLADKAMKGVTLSLTLSDGAVIKFPAAKLAPLAPTPQPGLLGPNKGFLG